MARVLVEAGIAVAEVPEPVDHRAAGGGIHEVDCQAVGAAHAEGEVGRSFLQFDLKRIGRRAAQVGFDQGQRVGARYGTPIDGHGISGGTGSDRSAAAQHPLVSGAGVHRNRQRVHHRGVYARHVVAQDRVIGREGRDIQDHVGKVAVRTRSGRRHFVAEGPAARIGVRQVEHTGDRVQYGIAVGQFCPGASGIGVDQQGGQVEGRITEADVVVGQDIELAGIRSRLYDQGHLRRSRRTNAVVGGVGEHENHRHRTGHAAREEGTSGQVTLVRAARLRPGTPRVGAEAAEQLEQVVAACILTDRGRRKRRTRIVQVLDGHYEGNGIREASVVVGHLIGQTDRTRRRNHARSIDGDVLGDEHGVRRHRYSVDREEGSRTAEVGPLVGVNRTGTRRYVARDHLDVADTHHVRARSHRRRRVDRQRKGQCIAHAEVRRRTGRNHLEFDDNRAAAFVGDHQTVDVAHTAHRAGRHARR